MESKYRILSLHGGGIRGCIQAVILDRLNRETGFLGGGGALFDGFSLAAGTSTGGLIALGLAHELTPSFMKSVYVNDGKKIFADSFFDDAADLFGLGGADYNIENLELVLHNLFGDVKLNELKKKVLVTSMDLDYPVKIIRDENGGEKALRSWVPVYITNLSMGGGGAAAGRGSICIDSGRRNEHRDFGAFCSYPSPDLLVYKAALYTAAAPTYFPSVDGFVDGGVFAANPSVEALAHAMCARAFNHPPLENISLLSIGTGLSLKYLPGDSLDWGYLQWAKSITGMMLDGQNFSADAMCKKFLGCRYHSIMPVFPEGIDIKMDGVDMLNFMIEFAEQIDLTDAVQWIRKEWLDA